MKLKITILLIFVLSAILGFSQSFESVLEEDVPVKVIVGHYNDYEEVPEWKTCNENGETLYIAKFMNNTSGREIYYDINGNRVKDVSYKSRIPLLVSNYIDQQYDKPRILEYKLMKNLKEGLVEYQVVVKTKQEGEFVMKFDQQFTPLGVNQGLAAVAE